jgi:hypothetical protein
MRDAFLLFAHIKRKRTRRRRTELHYRYKGRLGSSLERWKCANDWLLMLNVYCAGRVPGPWGTHRFKVAPLLENKAKPQAMMNLLQFRFQSLPVQGEGAAPDNAGTYQGPLTPGWGVIAQRIGKPFRNEKFEKLYYCPGYRDIDGKTQGWQQAWKLDIEIK